MTPQRPALAEVLAALADTTRMQAPVDLDYVKRALVPPRIEIRDGKVYAPVESGLSGWYMSTDNPAEAIEALATAGMWPWEPSDGPTRWWCERCDGSGFMVCDRESGERDFCDRCAEEDPETTGGFRVTGHTPDPPSLATLVAVTSLGAPSLATSVELAGVLARGRVPTWRVMTREAIERHRDEVFETGTSNHPYVYLSAYANLYGDDDQVEYHRTEGDPEGANAVCGLAAIGVCVVALDASRIVLAVEAL